ncbi:MAG: DUF951 domain-containing protein [Faecalibacillus intestinalis]
MDYQLNDIVEMKKQHPCKKSNQWKIVRMGADIKIKCLGCNAIVMFSRRDFEKRLKKRGQVEMVQHGLQKFYQIKD